MRFTPSALVRGLDLLNRLVDGGCELRQVHETLDIHGRENAPDVGRVVHIVRQEAGEVCPVIRAGQHAAEKINRQGDAVALVAADGGEKPFQRGVRICRGDTALIEGPAGFQRFVLVGVKYDPAAGNHASLPDPGPPAVLGRRGWRWRKD